MKVNIVADLGGWLAYGKDEVSIHKSVLEMVPENKQGELKELAMRACADYRRRIDQAKESGEKVKPMAVKKDTMDTFRKWILQNKIKDAEVKRVRSTNPRIPSDDETPRVTQKKDYFVDTPVTKEEISSMFDTFNSEDLSDEVVASQETSSTSVELDDDLFDVDDILGNLDNL